MKLTPKSKLRIPKVDSPVLIKRFERATFESEVVKALGSINALREALEDRVKVLELENRKLALWIQSLLQAERDRTTREAAAATAEREEPVDTAKAASAHKGRAVTIHYDVVRMMRARGMSPTAIAKDLGVARSSVYRALKGAAA